MDGEMIVKQTMLVLWFVLAFFMLSACGSDEPPQTATIGELCDLEPNTVVQVEGLFELPSFLTCTGNECRIGFVDEGEYIFAEIYSSENPRSNMLRVPPDNYLASDLEVVLGDGTSADYQTRVLATGRIKKPSENSCYLDVSSVRLP